MSSDVQDGPVVLYEHENEILREKLVSITKLLNHSLRSASGMQIKSITDELISAVQSLKEAGGKYKSAQ